MFASKSMMIITSVIIPFSSNFLPDDGICRVTASILNHNEMNKIYTILQGIKYLVKASHLFFIPKYKVQLIAVPTNR